MAMAPLSLQAMNGWIGNTSRINWVFASSGGVDTVDASLSLRVVRVFVFLFLFVCLMMIGREDRQ